jgi:hypothetical protein
MLFVMTSKGSSKLCQNAHKKSFIKLAPFIFSKMFNLWHNKKIPSLKPKKMIHYTCYKTHNARPNSGNLDLRSKKKFHCHFFPFDKLTSCIFVFVIPFTQTWDYNLQFSKLYG